MLPVMNNFLYIRSSVVATTRRTEVAGGLVVSSPGFLRGHQNFSFKLKMHTLGEQAGNTKEISPAYGLYGYHILLSGVVRKMTWEHITWKRVHYVSKSFLVNQQFCSHEMCLTQTQFILKRTGVLNPKALWVWCMSTQKMIKTTSSALPNMY